LSGLPAAAADPRAFCFITALKGGSSARAAVRWSIHLLRLTPEVKGHDVLVVAASHRWRKTGTRHDPPQSTPPPDLNACSINGCV